MAPAARSAAARTRSRPRVSAQTDGEEIYEGDIIEFDQPLETIAEGKEPLTYRVVTNVWESPEEDPELP
jgi:hypothetical protein